MSKLTDFPVYSAKTKKRVKRGILASSLAVVLVMAALLSQPPGLDPMPGKISVILEAQVYRDGALVAERVNDDDLLVENFINMCQALLYWPNNADYEIDFLPRDEGGGSYDFYFWNETVGNTVAYTDIGTDPECTVDVGQSDAVPIRYDYDLDDSVYTGITLDSFSEDTDYFTLTFVWTNDQGSWTWYETGLMVTWYSDDYGDAMAVMLCKDVFAGISVVNNDVLVINYRFSFSTGYTENFMTLLLYLIMGCSDSGDVDIDLTDLGGTSRTVNIYSSDASEDEWFGHYDGTSQGGWIRLSNSASGIPSRSAYRLLGSSYNTYATVEVDHAPNYNVVASAVIIPGTAISVVAASYERYTSYVGGDAYFMMFALSHSAVYVAESTPVRAEFTLEL